MVTHKEGMSAAIDAWVEARDDVAGMEAAVRAYLDARELVMVPKEIDEEGAIALALEDYTMFPRSLWKDMLAAAPDPFGDAP